MARQFFCIWYQEVSTGDDKILKINVYLTRVIIKLDIKANFHVCFTGSNQTMHSKAVFVSMSLAASINRTTQGSSVLLQNTSTQILSPSNAHSTRTGVEKTRATTETPRTMIKASQTLTEKTRTAKENETRIRTTLPASTKQTLDKTLPKTMSPKPHATFSLTTSLGKQSKSVEMPIKTSEKPTKTVTERNKGKVFWWNVTTGTSKCKVYLELCPFRAIFKEQCHCCKS